MDLSNIGRRGFMGTVIGTSIATGLPFLARAAEPELVRAFPSPKEAQAMLLEFIAASPQEQMRYKFFLFLDAEQKEIMYGSPIKHIERSPNEVLVTAEAIEMRCSMTVHGLVFAKPDGSFIKATRYSSGSHTLDGPSWSKDETTGRDKLGRGDTLKHTYKLVISV